MHILIAPNAFKNSLDASEVAAAIGEGLESSGLECTTECFPIGDGGDGTAHLLAGKFKGKKIDLELKDPLGRKVKTSFALIDNGKTAVIDMADISGIRLLSERELNPFQTNSFGTGEMIIAALDHGVTKIIIGLGGSATVDGGAGILSALGFRFLDQAGKDLRPSPEDLSGLADIDISGVDQRVLECQITVLCDVENYLLGPKGAAAVFGPQKGAKLSDIHKLEAILDKIRKIALTKDMEDMGAIKHGGAAGGVAAALSVFLQAELVNGAQRFLSLTDFGKSLKSCDLLITGEGSLDEQTLQGKAPYAAAVEAKKAGVPVIGIAGKIPLQEIPALQKYFQVLLAIGNEPSDLKTAIENTRANLVRMGISIGNLLSIQRSK